MLLTKQEVNKRIKALEDWLIENEGTHYLYRCIAKECMGYEEAKAHMEYRGVEELNVKNTTAFYNQLNRL